VAIASLLSVAAAAGIHADHAQLGLSASYEALIGPPRTIDGIDDDLSTPRILQAWAGHAPDAFSVTWRGFIYVPADGPYTFATRSDGESTIYLDGRSVLENGGEQPDLVVRAIVRPDSGSHLLAIRYLHNGGPTHFELLWARGDEPLAPVPAWTLRTRTTAWPRILIARWLPPLLPGLAALAVVLLVAALAMTARGRRAAATGREPLQ
jgi:hypothetical protein